MISAMFNAFIKYQGWELFATYELANGENTAADSDKRNWNQIAADLIFRFGGREQLYVGARINNASGELTGTTTDVSATRFAGVFGWFMTPNIMTKLEIVDQSYSDYAMNNILHEANFNGAMLEAVIAF